MREDDGNSGEGEGGRVERERSRGGEDGEGEKERTRERGAFDKKLLCALKTDRQNYMKS